ncbi:MAG: carboxypeptidase regulatory-like domain-containing protein, partial [Vicinamibacterales bacterium]
SFVLARLCLVALVLLFASPAWAQFDSGTVLGTVRDTSGAVLPGASVTLLSTDTGIAAARVSDDRGNYEFSTVRVGTYALTIELAGFTSREVTGVKIDIGARRRVDVELSVGGLTEAISVTGAAPLLETDSSQRGQVISGEQTQALPLNGREYSALALLTTGVRLSFSFASGNTPREGSFNVNGLRSTFNNFLIDGVDNNAYGTSNQGFSNQVMQPPPDAVGEFKVVTNNVSAEYGRAAGATINVVYRSGTNQLHGSGWEFFRDTALNAEGFFKPATGKPELRRNQFGGVVGGPLVRNRAFFFVDYEGFRQTRRATAFASIPSAANRQGILPVAVRDPRTGAVYQAGTPIPMTPFAQAVLDGLPAATGSGAANNYSVSQAFTNDTDKTGGKVDVQLKPGLSAFGRYGWRDLTTFDQPVLPLPSGGDGNGTIYARNRQLALGSTWVPSTTSLFEVRFGFSKTQAGKNPPALGAPGALDAFGLTGLPSDSRIAGGLPTQTITGYTTLGRQATNPQWQYPTVFNPKVNYTWMAGPHSLKSGYEFQRINTEVQDVNPLYGRDTYAGQFSRPAGASANNIYNLADFMLGLRSQYALSNVLVANMRQNMHFLYVQDDWRVRDGLTLNLGLRYEYATPQWERDNILTNFDPATRTMVAARDGSIRDRSTINPDRNNFGPRLGFAWTAAERTVVRGGYGISYVHFHRAGGGNLLPINGPQVINAVVNQSPTDAGFLPTEQGYPQGLTDPAAFDPLKANITYMPSDYQSSRVQSWYVSLQRELGHGILVDVAYVANRADGLLLFANYNQARPNNAAGTLSLQERRPIPEFADITYAFNGGKSRYRALQGKFEWRHRDLTMLSSLTLSVAKDNGAGSLENPNGNFPAPQDVNNLDADFGYSAYHQPYNSTTSVVWSLPFGRGKHWGGSSRIVDALAGGWQLAAINSLFSGEPVTFTYTPTNAFIVSGIAQDFRGANNYRPNVSGDPYASSGTQSITNWFNRDAVVIPTDPSQPFGNAERNSVRGPMFWQIDMAASKQVPLTRSVRVEFRIEAFNLLNRTNFRAPNGNRSSNAFGTITSTYDPRQLQLGLKLLW